MEITRKDPMTGKWNTMDIDVTQQQLDAWRSGKLIQDAMPHLSPDERDFIMAGYAAESWGKIFSEEEQ